MGYFKYLEEQHDNRNDGDNDSGDVPMRQMTFCDFTDLTKPSQAIYEALEMPFVDEDKLFTYLLDLAADMDVEITDQDEANYKRVFEHFKFNMG